MAIGIDEVGRGAWAGPLLVVAYRQLNDLPTGVNDSKKLTKKRRESLARELGLYGESGFGWVEPAAIDELGLTAAMRLAVDRALTAINALPQEAIVMDGHINYCPENFAAVQVVVGADASHPMVGAASIVAKVARDNVMVGLAGTYPGYGFELHMGYGTKKHQEALKLQGVCDIHRKSYAPIKNLA